MLPPIEILIKLYVDDNYREAVNIVLKEFYIIAENTRVFRHEINRLVRKYIQNQKER